MTQGRFPDRDAQRKIVQWVGGGSLHNAVRERGVTCQMCATPVQPPHVECYRCARFSNMPWRMSSAGVRPLVVPVVYGIDGAQSGWLMRRYKGPFATAKEISRVTLLLALARVRHQRCFEYGRGPIEGWATVPSTSGRPGEHPLRRIAVKAEPPGDEIVLVPGSEPPDDPRELSATRWAVADPGRSTGRHVLLIDDTWTTGAKALGAVIALHAAGAAAVTVLVLARWIRPGYGDNAQFISARLTADYSPDVCPVTGGYCPRM